MQPLVSCLCPTKNKPSILINAIACFKAQTYPNTELILVTDEESEYKDIIEHFVCDNIKLVLAPHKSTISALRNISVDNAKGEYVVTWDDDDIHHRDRLRIQYAAIAESSYSACYLKRVLVHDMVGGNKGISKDRMGMELSMFALKESMPRYDETKRSGTSLIAEDIAIKRFFISTGKVMLINEPHLYIYNIHSDNTCEYNNLRNVIDVII